MLFIHLRKHMKTIFWAIMILIVPAFVIWNIGDAVKNRRSGFVGTLHGKRVPLAEFNRARQAALIELSLRLGPQAAQTLDIEEQAWTRLILLQEARRKNITVANEELLDYLNKLPLFQQNAVSAQEYTAFVVNNFRATPVEFENAIRGSLIVEKLMQEITAGVVIDDQTIQQLYQREHETLTVDYLLIAQEQFSADIEIPDDEQLMPYFTEHAETFKVPEQVDVEYLSIAFEDFKDKQLISAAAVQQYYDQHQTRFTRTEPETGVAPLTDVEDEIRDILLEQFMQDRAREKARQVMSKLYASADMAAAAAEYDLIVRQTGPFAMFSALPEIGLSYPFMQAAFSVTLGEVSGIIETPAALYILKPVKKLPAHIPEFATVREAVIEHYRQFRAKEYAAEAAQNILALIRQRLEEQGQSFAEAAAGLDYTIHTSAPFARAGAVPELGYAPEFTAAAFAAAPDTVGGPITVETGYCLFQRRELIGADETQFAAQKESYRQRVLQQQRNQAINDWFAQLKLQANPIAFTDNPERE